MIGPILDAEQGRITFRRFHRRAARDGAGRQFSFIFYVPPATARQINARIAASPELTQWQRRGVIDKVIYDDPVKPQRPGIGDTSDKTWTPGTQRAWPYYIMGVSRLWLELIREYGQSNGLPQAPKERYVEINQILDTLWRDQGGHALLHHLSAVFGYQQVAIIRRQLMRFQAWRLRDAVGTNSGCGRHVSSVDRTARNRQMDCPVQPRDAISCSAKRLRQLR